MKNLYRRYRPLELGDVVGQEQVTSSLEKSLKAGKVGHAYLFIGPRGTGKTSVARIFAHEVNGFKYELEDDYVDIVEIDGASNRGIDNIRELREKALIAPTSGKYKIYIIDEVHMLTKEAFNALLKTLEEPPAHVIFIMATTDAYKVPVTITSRAQTYTFKLAEADVMLDFLRSVAKKEKIKISDEALEIIVKRGGGSFRDSLSLLDQLSTLSDDEITKEMVVAAMGLPEDEKIAELLGEYASGDVVKITTVLKDLLAAGIKPETLAEEMVATIIENPKPESMPLLAKLPEVREPFGEAKLLVALCGEIKVKTTIIEKEVIRSNETKKVATNKKTAFNWEELLEKIKGVSEVIYKQLEKCEREVRGGVLHLYPRTKIIKNILESKNNKRILLNVAENIQIEIHEAGEHPELAAKDETLSKISDIMGGEVKNDGGYDPFQ
ncbi:DNA polymerase III subunit gamma/tau [Candidatus Saccharibacteria bacterium]|nr:DNA polymerase III subunit gamma/tau [Candidatus Saccharibacteria bacterium]